MYMTNNTSSVVDTIIPFFNNPMDKQEIIYEFLTQIRIPEKKTIPNI